MKIAAIDLSPDGQLLFVASCYPRRQITLLRLQDSEQLQIVAQQNLPPPNKLSAEPREKSMSWKAGRFIQNDKILLISESDCLITTIQVEAQSIFLVTQKVEGDKQIKNLSELDCDTSEK